ncbi:M17 family metallopeptidase [Mycoplasma phocoenae]|uniref:Probable cytosol aminopeptidase n=1 Tax=Mycoplasma phocoenae TaxID=754517 RepID=A0A858U7N7_9MOLU|nr:M17 family metallopeptidase [Mycoplasma phocoenae]QJG66788.1 leucyl aminopeptidase family protein [Mycoplasma phocoenae]
MIKLINEKNTNLLLKAVFKGMQFPEAVLEKNNVVTELHSKKIAYAFLGEKENYKYSTLKAFVQSFVASQQRDFQIDVRSFTTGKVSSEEVVKAFHEAFTFKHASVFTMKTNQTNEEPELSLYSTKDLSEAFNIAQIHSEAITFTRNLQRMVPNIANSEYLAQAYLDELKQYPNLKVKVLNKKDIEKHNMGLLLSVNRGSMYEARLVVVEYNGNPESEEKLALVGKGITFDSGGYSLKPSRFMLGMKYDMSGSAIVAGAMKVIAQTKPKSNVVAVLPLTDNRVNGDASIPDAVWTSMNGKTVEINNTDAEGRLVLADGMTYAIRESKATKVLTIATLTGAILSAFGTTHTGIWATNDNDWKALNKSAELSDELVWRMPLHEAYSKGIKDTKVADLKNTDLSGNAGSSSAAMFLKEFAEDKDFIHVDIAGTAEINDVPMGVMVKTLSQLAKHIK